MEEKHLNEEKNLKKKKKGSLLSNIILVIALCVFVYAGYNLWQIFAEYNEGSSEYKSIIDEVIIERVPIAEDGEVEQDVIFEVDFDKLKEMNSDAIGWIRFEEPERISYPVVLGVDNEKYLTTTFEGNKNAAGALFIDMINNENFNDRNTFIYGHNMKDGSMFGQLRKYKQLDFCKENPYFYIYTPDGREMKYEIFSVAIVDDPCDSYIKQYADDAAFESYLNHIKSVALYNTGATVNKDSKIVSLSTCTNVTETQRLLVHAVRVSIQADNEQSQS